MLYPVVFGLVTLIQNDVYVTFQDFTYTKQHPEQKHLLFSQTLEYNSILLTKMKYTLK